MIGTIVKYKLRRAILNEICRVSVEDVFRHRKQVYAIEMHLAGYTAQNRKNKN